MPGKKKPPEKKGVKVGEYMVSYADMMTLLFAFFVLMMGDPIEDPRQMRLFLSAFTGSLGVFEGGTTLSKGALVDMGQTIESLPSPERGHSLARSTRQAQEVLRPEIRAKQVRVQEDERGITISLASDAFFAPGSAVLDLDRSSELLRKVAQLVVASAEQNIAIEGHTDDMPIVSDIFRSNWQLSTARANAVLDFLATEGVAERRMQIVGYADTRPIENNDTPEGRAYNRRVDIIMLRN